MSNDTSTATKEAIGQALDMFIEEAQRAHRNTFTLGKLMIVIDKLRAHDRRVTRNTKFEIVREFSTERAAFGYNYCPEQDMATIVMVSGCFARIGDNVIDKDGAEILAEIIGAMTRTNAAH